ncbi:hypothetical protein [Glycomyces endophyticus]
MTENRTIEPDALNEGARLLFDLAEAMREQYRGVGEDYTATADRFAGLLPAGSSALSDFEKRWSGYEYKDMVENVTALAEYLAVFAADAEAVEDYIAADFNRLADPALFGTEIRAAAVDTHSAATTYDGPR